MGTVEERWGLNFHRPHPMAPLHAAAVHFPLVLVPLSVVADWVGFVGEFPSVRLMARAALFLGWVTTGIAIFLGYADMNQASANPAMRDVLRYVELHLQLGWIGFVAVTLLGIWRFRVNLGKATQHRAYLGCATLVLGLYGFLGWYGGELVYTAGINVVPANRSAEDPVAAQHRLDAVFQAVTKIPGLHPKADPSDITETIAPDPNSPVQRHPSPTSSNPAKPSTPTPKAP